MGQNLFVLPVLVGRDPTGLSFYLQQVKVTQEHFCAALSLSGADLSGIVWLPSSPWARRASHQVSLF